MIAFAPSLKAVGGAHTGIAPVSLLDIQDTNGNFYYWCDRTINGANVPVAITASSPAPPSGTLPIAIPPGQAVTYSYPTVVTPVYTPGPNTAAGDLGGGTVESLFSNRLESGASLTWSGFEVPDLPGGAVIQNVIAVAQISGSGDLATNGGNMGIPIAGDFDGQFTSEFGTTAAAITSAQITISVSATLADGATGQYVTLRSPVLVVYYSVPSTIPGIGPPPPPVGSFASAPYLPWILEVPSFSFFRSLQTSVGSFVIQNVSGDTLSRDPEKLLRASALEGAFFVYRLWQPDAEAAWMEVHGTLTVDDVGVDTLTFKAMNLLNPSQDDTPLETYCETCQLQWGGARCGSTQSTECEYSYQTCQVVERIMVVTNDYEKNYGEASANTALNVINRRRKI